MGKSENMNDKVLAVVDGTEITESALERIAERYPADKRIYFETDQGRKQLLEQKVAFSVFSRYAKEKGLDRTDEFTAKINDITEQLLTQTVIGGLFAGVCADEAEAKRFYDENPDRFVLEETVSAKHILVDTEEQASEIKKSIDSGEITFEDAAARHSKCPSKDRGGALGYFGRGKMAKEFEDAAFTQPVGMLGSPVRTQFGWHLIITDDKVEKRMLSFDEVKKKLIEQLKEKKQQDIYEAKYNELKSLYAVTIFEDKISS